MRKDQLDRLLAAGPRGRAAFVFLTGAAALAMLESTRQLTAMFDAYSRDARRREELETSTPERDVPDLVDPGVRQLLEEVPSGAT